MRQNTIRLEGVQSVWELVTAWLNLPREQKLFTALTEKEHAKTITVVSEQMTKGAIQTLDALDKIVEMYKKLGYPVETIEKVMGPRVESTINVFNKLSCLKYLKERGLIEEANIRKPLDLERRSSQRYETRPEIQFKVSQRWHKGYVCDISETGAQIVADQPLKRNDRTTVRLRDFANSKEIKLDGVVVWQKEGEAENYSNRFGLHFEEMLPAPATCFIPTIISEN